MIFRHVGMTLCLQNRRQCCHGGNIWHIAYGSGYMIFDYNFFFDGNECSTNPCQNGGTFIDGCAVTVYLLTQELTVSICLAIFGFTLAMDVANIPDDPLWNYSDPYTHGGHCS